MSATIESSVINNLVAFVNQRRERPIYFEVLTQEDGTTTCRQVEFITVEQFAAMMNVSPRTVYYWIDKASEQDANPTDHTPPVYRPPGTRAVLFDLHEAVLWIKGRLESDSTPS